MSIFFAHRFRQGQSSLEYLLLLAVVAVIVIASFNKGSLIDQVHDTSQNYYNSVSRVIMGENPTLIDGGWCPVANPASNSAGPKIMYRACECPPPAFGGKACTDPTNPTNSPNSPSCQAGQQCNGPEVILPFVTACGPCPSGEVCNAQGQCGCSNGLTCNGQNGSPAGSIPLNGCTSCGCPTGTYINAGGTACVTCTPTGSGQCTTTSSNGQGCTALTGPGGGGCATNMYCDTTSTDTTYNSCQCEAGAYWDPSLNGGSGGCQTCPQCQLYSTAQHQCVDASTTICPASGNWTCSTTVAPSQECQCWTGYGPNGKNTGCSPCTANCTGKVCGSDGCGGSCGTCPTVSNPLATTCSNLGQCVCTPQCPVNATCGDSNGCGGLCQGVCFTSGQDCISGSCQSRCSDLVVGSGACTVTLPYGTISGTNVSLPCPSGCAVGPVTDTCNNGSWSNSSPAACAPGCTGETVTNGPCSETFGTTADNNTATGTCSAGCSGTVHATCSNQAWGSVTGTCIMASCGSVGQNCCIGSSCYNGEICSSSNKCEACGGVGEPCCSGSSCNSGGICSGGSCQACGGYYQQCCANSTCSTGVCSSYNVCVNGCAAATLRSGTGCTVSVPAEPNGAQVGGSCSAGCSSYSRYGPSAVCSTQNWSIITGCYKY